MKVMTGSQQFGVVVALLVGATLVGCDQAKPPAPPPPAPAVTPKAQPQAAVPAPAEAPKAQPKATAPTPSKYGAKLEKEGWTLLGQQQADRKRDTDRIIVGGKKGTFREIAITVDGAPLDMESMVVTFGNGKQFKPALRHSFNATSHSRAIDLPGEKRGIQHVDFVYRSVGTAKQEKATISIYGR